MTVLKSAIDTNSKAFRANAKALGALVADLQAKVSQVKDGGGQAAREKHLARGKLLPREWVGRLLDPGAPSLELTHRGASGLYGRAGPAAGLI
ncbi:MAG: methylcrotonoyl-CoA carboxylase, partial [Kiloniellales bacterium]|nr:methylcrotonoyl-CoA carboxylase [Kiloniellales bacterium]